MKVRDIMTKDIVLLDCGSSVLEAARLMKHHNIGCIPITKDAEKVVGMITDRDIVLRMVSYNKSPEKEIVDHVMTENIYSVEPSAEVDQALKLMKKQQIRRLPVIENGNLVGMVALGDFAVESDYNTETSEALAEISMPARVDNI